MLYSQHTVHDVRNPYGRKKNRTRVRFRAQAPILLVKVEKKNVDCFLGLFFVFCTAVRFSVRPYDFVHVYASPYACSSGTEEVQNYKQLAGKNF